MKKIFSLAIATMASLAVMAAGQKPVVYVEYFDYAVNTVGEVNAVQVRNHVISALTSQHYIQVIDAAAQNSLSAEDARRSSEAALADPTSRLSEMKQLGANYILMGNVLNINVAKTVNDKGEVYYKTTMSYTVKAVDTETGTVIESKTYNYDGGGISMKFGYSKDEQQSVQDCFKFIDRDMVIFVTKNFPLKGYILESDYELDKKGKKMVSCYISLGSDDGLDEKTKFDVKLQKMIAGRVTASEIKVDLKVKEIVAGDLARCTVSGGDAEKLATAMDEYIRTKAADPEHALPILVIMKPKKDDAGWGDMWK